MLSFLRQTSPVRLAIFLLFALTCYRLWFITQMEMVPDEAYYWLWSEHLAASYRDKGPGVAWIIALGTKMFGNTVFGIRFFAVILSTGTSALLFLLARRLYDDRVALWSVVLASVIPMMAVGSILMTIDSLSVFFWALAVLIFWKALHREQSADWFWLGLAIGAGFLAKFTNGVQLGCIAFFLLWSKEHRRLLFSWKMVVLGAAFSLSISADPLVEHPDRVGSRHRAAFAQRGDKYVSNPSHGIVAFCRRTVWRDVAVDHGGNGRGRRGPHLETAHRFARAFFVEPVFAGLRTVPVFQPEQRGQGELGGPGTGRGHYFHGRLLAGSRGAAAGLALGRGRGLCPGAVDDGGDAQHGTADVCIESRYHAFPYAGQSPTRCAARRAGRILPRTCRRRGRNIRRIC